MKKIKVFTITTLLFIVTFSYSQKFGPTAEDSLECIKNLSLYREYFKQWRRKGYTGETIKDIIPHWRYCFIKCPKATENIYINGVKIFSHLLKDEPDAARKDKFIDTLMMVYDKRIKYFGKEGDILGRKGVDLYKMRPDNVEEYYNILDKSFTLLQEKSQYIVLIYLFRSTIKYVAAGKAENSLIVETYDKLNEIAEYNIKNNIKYSKKYQSAKDDIDRNFKPYASCENLVSIYQKKFEENPTDTNLLIKITRILDEKECTKEPLFFYALKSLHKLKPNGQSAFLLGKMSDINNNWNEASVYLQEAIKLIEKDNKKADAYLLLANIHKNLKELNKAREFALGALKHRPNDGKPYILIGDMYIASANECVDVERRKELESKVAYWAAIDKYKKAKEVDKTVVELANNRISTYSKYFPDENTMFFFNLEKGQTYKVGCWINETTIVR